MLEKVLKWFIKVSFVISQNPGLGTGVCRFFSPRHCINRFLSEKMFNKTEYVTMFGDSFRKAYTDSNNIEKAGCFRKLAFLCANILLCALMNVFVCGIVMWGQRINLLISLHPHRGASLNLSHSLSPSLPSISCIFASSFFFRPPRQALN